MKFEITYRNLPKDQHQAAREVVERYARRHLEPALEAFAGKPLRLRVTLEKRRLDHRATCRVQLPGRKLIVAQHSAEGLDNAVHEAILELARQAEKHRARLSHEADWRRKARRERLKRLRAPDLSDLRQQVEVSLASLLPRLETWIRHELTYLRASGLLAEDYPTTADVRDEMYVRIQSDWDELPHDPDGLYRAAMKVIHEILEGEKRRAARAGQALSLEQAAPEDAMTQAEDMVEEEINEFYQPDEALQVEDLIADTEIASPEAEVEPEAVDACLEFMGALPTRWRRAVLLVHQEGIPVDTAADILEMAEARLREILTVAELYITERLEERGFGTAELSRLCRR